MKLVLVISHLGCGGAERVITLMANYWSEQGHEVYLMTLAKVGVYCAYPIAKSVHLVSAQEGAIRFLGKPGKLLALRKKVRAISPDAVISFGDQTNVLVLLALLSSGVKVIVSERSNPSRNTMGFLYFAMHRLLYPLASALVLQTRSVKQWFADHGYRVHSHVIPNPIMAKDDRLFLPVAKNILDKRSNIILSVGRLAEVKGYDRLIKIFSRIHYQHPLWKLVIVGEGAERETLEALIAEMHLKENVQLIGRVDSPIEFLKQAAIFAFTSHFEGFPNALCEAMAEGLPVVSFDCPYGPAEIIENGVNGLLIENGNLDAFAAAITGLIDHPEKRRELGEKASAIREKLSMDVIMGQWEQLLHEPKDGGAL